jgi:hypothetical protein
VSVNSDEIAEGILKAVGQLAVIAGVIYCIYSYPWLWLLLIPVALVFIAWAVWDALKRRLASSPSTLHKVGQLLIWSGLIGFLVGGCAYYLGHYDWWGLPILGGLCGMAIGAVMKDQAEQRELKRRGPARSILEEWQEAFGDPKPENEEQRKHDSLKRVQDQMARILNQPKK